jgi:hypothetical protein
VGTCECEFSAWRQGHAASVEQKVKDPRIVPLWQHDGIEMSAVSIQHANQRFAHRTEHERRQRQPPHEDVLCRPDGRERKVIEGGSSSGSAAAPKRTSRWFPVSAMISSPFEYTHIPPGRLISPRLCPRLPRDARSSPKGENTCTRSLPLSST